MQLETDAPEGGTEAEAVAETSQVEAANADNSEETAEQQTGADDAGQADETGDTPKRKPWWEKRFDELTAKRYDAERDAAYWRGVAEGGGPKPRQPQRAEGPPSENDFDDYNDYQAALIDYRVEQRLNAAKVEEQRGQVLRTYEERAAKLREAKTDYDSVVGDPTLRITPLMAEVIRESDVGPEVAYHLGTNRAEAERIASLPQHQQAAALGRLEERLTVAPKPNPKPIPPAPPQTVSGLSAGLSKGPEDMSMSEYIEWRKKAEA